MKMENIILMLKSFSFIFNKIKTILYILFCFLSSNPLFSQESYIQGETSLIVYPSPGALSPINYNDELVSLYTGKLNINIPLYTVQSRGINVDISLNYNSDIKIDDQAGPVGLGWNLNAGGAITRVMSGLPDEYDGLYMVGENNYQAYGYLTPQMMGKSDRDYFFSDQTTDSDRHNLLKNTNHSAEFLPQHQFSQVWDTEPDEFYFHFGKYSGKFVFDKNGDIRIIPHQNLKITKTITPKDVLGEATTITSFEVTTPEGVKYIFGNKAVSSYADLTAVEVTYYSSYNISAMYMHDYKGIGDPDKDGIYEYLYNYERRLIDATQRTEENLNIINFLSTWYLTEITSPQGNTINFTYQDGGHLDYLTSCSNEMVMLYLYKGSWGNVDYIYSGSCEPDGYPEYASSTETANYIYSKSLVKISSPDGSCVKFYSSSGRSDLVGGTKIDKIDIVDQYSNTIKSFNLSYEFTKSPLTYQNPHGIPEVPASWNNKVDSAHYRMYLKELAESSPESVKPPYRFIYYNSGEYVLPRRMLSWYRDYWGYHTTYVDDYKLVKSGSLYKMIYPTGGAKEFTYEKNTCGNEYAGGVRVKQVTTYPVDGFDTGAIKEIYGYLKGYAASWPKRGYIFTRNFDYTRGCDRSLNYMYTTKGGNVGYEEVHKKVEGSGEIIYKFIGPNKMGNTGSEVYQWDKTLSKRIYPLGPDNDVDYKRGLVDTIIVK